MVQGSSQKAEISNRSGAPVVSVPFFQFREFSENAFRAMEIQICGETQTVQFCVWDHGGDHPTSPSAAIPFSDAEDLATWILAALSVAREANIPTTDNSVSEDRS